VVANQGVDLVGGLLRVSPPKAEIMGELGADDFVIDESGLAFMIYGSGARFGDIVEEGGESQGGLLLC
jgi:hypothetical protein